MIATAPPTIDALLEKVIEKTRTKQARWEVTQEGYELPLTAGSIRVSKRQEVGSGSETRVRFLTPEGVEVWTADDPILRIEPKRVAELYRLAADSATSGYLSDLWGEIEAPAIGLMSGPQTRLPEPLTLQDELRIFRRIAGNWRLRYSRVDKIIQITPTGLYLIEAPFGSGSGASGSSGSGGYEPDSSYPEYQLRLVAKSSDDRVIEIAKDDVYNGERLHIETLTLEPPDAPTRMVGEMKHDRLRLTYIRNGLG